MTRFYVPYPTCRLPIRGRSHGQELDFHVVEFEAEQYFGDDEPVETRFVTIDPKVPWKYGAAERGEPCTFPTMTLLHLIGDENGLAFFESLSRGHEEDGRTVVIGGRCADGQHFPSNPHGQDSLQRTRARLGRSR